jgi:long-chain acyl-CoA synthetase
MLQNVAANHPDSTALTTSNQHMSYRELEANAARFGKALLERGTRKDDRVALYLPNFPEFVIAYYGALWIGAILVAISPQYKERELIRVLTDSEAKVIVCWDRLLPSLNAARGKTNLRHVFTLSVRSPKLQPPPTSQHGIVEEDMNITLAKTGELRRVVEIQPKTDVALLQYTGGTTGVPKGAMLTHYNLVVNAVQFSRWLGMTPREVHLAALPLFHIYGMTTAMNAPLFTAGSMVLLPDPGDTDSILHAINQFKPSIFCGVPTMYQRLINHPNIQGFDLRSIRVCVSGASPLRPQVQRGFEELTGGRLVEGYGLTETSPVTHVNPLDSREKNRTGSIGIPISDTDAKIVDVESGLASMPPGTPGELIIHGPQAMKGYWRNSLETSNVLREGWIYTGDIAIMDSNGYFRIIDRKKDMINVSGLKVWPREVEEVLYENEAVEEVAAVAAPDSKSGESVKVFVVLKENYKGKVSPSDITEFCRERLANYKTPKTVVFRESLPKSSVGKILRRQLSHETP